MSITIDPAVKSNVHDESLPFALLACTLNAGGHARREAGEATGEGLLTVSGPAARLTGGGDKATLSHIAALEKACAWLNGEADGDYSVRWYNGHRAPVEMDVDGLALDAQPQALAIDALALAWVAALIAAREKDTRKSLRRVAAIYRAMNAREQAAVQSALADGSFDAGNLAAIFLTRSARETSDEELVRWESWFLGQRRVDLPYDRKAVIDILESDDIDPDQKRIELHNAVAKYDWKTEQANMARIVADVRANNQELVFGRMSRAFHNQSLLFANAGYVLISDDIREKVAALAAECLNTERLAPPADRLRTMLQGLRESSLTGVIGAIELLEDAILDEQRKQVDSALKAQRAGRASGDCHSIMASAEHLLGLCRQLRDSILSAQRRPAAFVLLSQRMAPLESHLMVRINELQEPYLGKPENLKELVRQGGNRMYSSPDYSWLRHADHWVEAIPLFIKERVLVIDGQEVTETVIDQQILEETFREQFADHWACGIDNVMDSEHVALARELIADVDDRIAGDDRARAAAVTEHNLAEAVGALAALINYGYRHHAEFIHQRAESDGLSRYDTLRAILQHNIDTDHPQCLAAELHRRIKAKGTSLAAETLAMMPELEQSVRDQAAKLSQISHLPRRALPSLHVLTTQSSRMSDSYVRTWLEESMAQFNVIRAHGLDGEVNAKIAGYRTQISELGARLIRDLGMWAEVEELMAMESLPEGAAVGRIIAGNATISRQLAIIAVLGEHFGLPSGQEAPLVDELLAKHGEELRAQSIRAVYERNDLELLPKMDAYRQENPLASEDDAISALILGDPEYADDLVVYTRFGAREMAVREIDSQDSSLHLAARVNEWLRAHSRLALTTARRETLMEHDLNHLTLHPLYYYRAAGGNKRFHQLYTPSRVDLGTHERESVEKWSQWVGGADREASRVGRRVYGLINKNVKMFDSLTEPEVIKTGENASMVSIFAYSNAMSLLVNSVGRGDIEDLGDQMSLRKDRLIRPGGEGYGGYCVPKDGLFLEFVLILTRATKLRQLGVPDHLHAGTVAFSEYLLGKRGEFATEVEWEAWAMKLVAERKELNEFFSLREGKDGPVPVFQVTRIARALTQLGRPELRESFDVLANLAARWGIHKVIVGGEQVNRFMVFYKVWLTYRAMEEAKKLNPGIKIKDKDFSVVLCAEYKPNTQDGRYSVGMRKYELFAGTGDHLTYSLDTSGQDLAHLMLHGFENLWQQRSEPRMRARLSRLLAELQVKEQDEASISRLRALFPGYQAPAEIRMVSPMMLTTADLLHYTSDTLLEPLAMGVQRRLMNAGLTENEISANMLVYGPRLERWTKVRDMREDEKRALIDRIGGEIHALALSIIGPSGNFEMAVQGADVLDAGIPHDELLALLDNPVKVRDMMLEGNPNSALVIMDGASGARNRALNRLAVMRWFAAAEAIGRNSMYRCMGVGSETIESWREEMRHQRNRARNLFDALVNRDVEAARERFGAIVTDLRDGQESALFLETEERMIRFGKQTDQEKSTARALAAVTAGLPLEKLDFATWLALGGQFQVIGMSDKEFAALRASFEQAVAKLGGAPSADEATVDALYCPAFVPAVEEFREEKGVESSNKATEEVAAVAIDTRKRLAERAARARALAEREKAFNAVLIDSAGASLEALLAEGKALRGDKATISQADYGRLQGLTRLAFLALGREFFTEDANLLKLLEDHLELVFMGRLLDPVALRTINGGYEDPGDIARLAQSVAEAFRDGKIDEATRDKRIALTAEVAELFDCCRAIDLTIDFTMVEAEPPMVWRALADFFAESLNDHFYEYRPWVYSRGIGFAHIKGDALYKMAVDHHRWLYNYLRNVALTYTELAGWDAAMVDELLGDLDAAAEHCAIGADAESAVERQWRAYNQLREISFIRNDGFPLPQVFPALDPAIIKADERTNLVAMYPVGRTHISRALMEGPTLSAELAAQGKPGANLMITRDLKIADAGLKRPVLQIHNAHLYISRKEYIAALTAQGMPAAQANEQADLNVGPKGVRIAARFTSPVTAAVIFPFHGNPKYDSGLLEEYGLPYSCQSLFHTWTTYDKAKYPAIFNPATGVEIPGEMDWLASYTGELGEEATRKALEFGDARRHFPGLREFGKRFRLVMVKDAAESGGRGQKAFTLRNTDGTFDDAAIAEAVEFTYQITLKHNVAIQEVIIASPECWATEEFMGSFVDRQVQDWGAVVNRTKRPRTSIYGSQRLIFSTGKPGSGEWNVSHPITLNSRQLITNVGRGGTLDHFKPEFIRPEHRELLWKRMVEAGEKCMNALAKYGDISEAQYEAESGRKIGADATGVSYAFPRYMMLDFLVQPIFAEEGTLVDFEPTYDSCGNRDGVRLILQQGDKRITGTIKDWRVVLIEPNIGIGLWDRLAIREEFYNVRATEKADWHTVGANARIVLGDMAQAGSDYLKAIS